MNTTELLVAMNMFNLELPSFLIAVSFIIIAIMLVIGGLTLLFTRP